MDSIFTFARENFDMITLVVSIIGVIIGMWSVVVEVKKRKKEKKEKDKTKTD